MHFCSLPKCIFQLGNPLRQCNRAQPAAALRRGEGCGLRGRLFSGEGCGPVREGRDALACRPEPRRSRARARPRRKPPRDNDDPKSINNAISQRLFFPRKKSPDLHEKINRSESPILRGSLQWRGAAKPVRRRGLPLRAALVAPWRGDRDLAAGGDASARAASKE